MEAGGEEDGKEITGEKVKMGGLGSLKRNLRILGRCKEMGRKGSWQGRWDRKLG